jgi:uncharacterized protein
MRIGIAFSPAAEALAKSHPDDFDYIEVPFELLQHDPSAIAVSRLRPVVLHCASLSLGGAVRPPSKTVTAIRNWIRRTKTPWLGEHLSFITADRHLAGEMADEYAPGQPYNIGYTVSPPMNADVAASVASNVSSYADAFRVPLLLENPPLYFVLPGTTMSQVDFIKEVCRVSSTGLLLDVSHFVITATNVGFDPFTELLRLPLNRVVEMHISGFSTDGGSCWDDHAAAAPEIVLELLSLATKKTHAAALTLEYNWSADFPTSVLIDEVTRVKKVVQGRA